MRNDVGSVYVQTFEATVRNWMGLPSSGMCVFNETCGLGVALEHNGDLYSCDHFVEPEYLIGNIGDTDMGDLVASKRQHEFGMDKRDTLPQYCMDCDVRFACHGECPKNRFIETPDGEPGLNYLCAGFKDFFHHVDEPMQVPKILLCIAWTTKEQRRLAEMYPEVLGTDLTNKVNNEKRPLCLGVGIDARRRNFTWVSAFFPSKARWVFDWFFGVSLPALFTERTLHNIRLSITDEDERCFSAFQALSGEGKTFPLADSRLCSWHKINRGLRKTLSARIENMR